jgi:hypothetical protein
VAGGTSARAALEGVLTVVLAAPGRPGVAARIDLPRRCTRDAAVTEAVPAVGALAPCG